MKTEGIGTVDAKPEAEEAWVEHCKKHYPSSVWSRCNNWYNKSSQGSTAGTVDGYIGRYSEYLHGLREKGMAGLQFQNNNKDSDVETQPQNSQPTSRSRQSALMAV